MKTPEMVFMLGLPAAGKSTTAAQLFPNHTRLDADEFKAQIPGYVPARAAEFHEASSLMMEQAFCSAVATGAGQWVIDGTGSHTESMVRRIRQAQAMGFHTKLVYVVCSLATSLRRAAARERHVPESVIREKALNISTAFEVVAQYTDEVRVIHND